MSIVLRLRDPDTNKVKITTTIISEFYEDLIIKLFLLTLRVYRTTDQIYQFQLIHLFSKSICNHVNCSPCSLSVWCLSASSTLIQYRMSLRGRVTFYPVKKLSKALIWSCTWSLFTTCFFFFSKNLSLLL